MSKAIELTDDGLVQRMIAGDEEAFTLLYRRRHPAVYRFVLHMSGNASIADDVTQEVFMALIRDAKRFDPARGNLIAFLFGIARNHLYKRWEQDKRLVPIAGDSNDLESIANFGGGEKWRPVNGATRSGSNGYGGGNGGGSGNGHHHSATIGDELIAKETVDRVRHAVATLPANYREVVVLCELEEMSYEAAAAALDCPIGTVRSRLHRARTILIEKLREPQMVRRASAVGE